MASLGATGTGLFTAKTEGEGEVLVEATHGKFDVIHPSEDELIQRQEQFDMRKKEREGREYVRPSDAPPSYTDTIQQLPVGFYFPKDNGITLPSEISTHISFPGQVVPFFNPTASLPKACRRPWHDTFRPPHGPPVFFPVSIGYGPEVGLENGLQALWDPVTKTYFFLDHFRHMTFFEDPRPLPQPKPVVERVKQIFGDQQREAALPPDICTNSQIIHATATRAFSKPQGCTLFACGVHGQQGAPGATGSRGIYGSPGLYGVAFGSYGHCGGDGGPGGPGTPGSRGNDGTDGSDIILSIYGDPSKLNVTGSSSFVAKLGGTQAEEVLFVTCRGGDGGHGGQGGNGGVGGSGGCGGNGAIGQHGHSSPNGPGGSGGNGGNGGDGGKGGMGGPGGRGADGGHAGFGGKLVVQTPDPRLLVLVEADCRAGNKGKGARGGKGGSGGSGGSGGFGGCGGSGGSGGTGHNSDGSTFHYYNGPGGLSGFSGQCGFKGPHGQDGSSGIDGNPANDGGILWVVCSSDGSVLYQSSTRFDAEVKQLKIVSAIDDGIFEPNERIFVSGVVVVNSGGLPLPCGPQAFMPSTKTIKFEPTKFDLPEILPNNVFEIPITYSGRIFDQPPPNVAGPFLSSAEFHPRIELLGRPFEKSFLHQKLVVQYPVKLAYLKCSENLGRGDVSVLDIGVQNISTLPYGGCAGSGGCVALQIHLDARLIPLGSANIYLSVVPYTLTYDPNIRDSMYIEMHEIPPGQTVNVQITIQMESRAELFDRCCWQADLYLRDKLIEYNLDKIRVSPFYLPKDPPADLLFVTDENISRKEFVFWQKILEMTEVSVDFWDINRYNGLSVDMSTNTRHQVSWEGKYTSRMILYPHCNLNQLWGIDIVRHFHGENHRNNPLRELNSSMILFIPPTEPHLPTTDKYADRGDKSILYHLSMVDASLELPENTTYGGRHLFQPGGGCSLASDKPYLKWEKKQLKKLEKENQSQSATVLSRHSNITSTGLFRYGYGEVDMRRIPLLCSSKFLVVDGAGGSMTNMSLDDPNLLPSSCEIPLASNYGQVFLAVVYGLPLSCKLTLMRNRRSEEGESTVRMTFTIPSGLTLSKAEIVMICAASEIADDIYSCSGTAQRMSEFAQQFEKNTPDFTSNGRIILRGMKLAVKEATKRKEKIKNRQVSRALKELKQLANIVACALKRAGIEDRNLEPMLSFQQLTQPERMHKSCQYRVKDEQWNIPG